MAYGVGVGCRVQGLVLTDVVMVKAWFTNTVVHVLLPCFARVRVLY